MPKVTFQPVNRTYEGKEGDSVLDVAIFHDVPLQHACGGFCACTTCQLVIESGGEHLTEMAEDEIDRLESVGKALPNSRLGCQAKFKGTGDVVVQIVNLDE